MNTNYKHFPKTHVPKIDNTSHHDSTQSDKTMLSNAHSIATERGETDSLSTEYIYRRMEQKQRVNINKEITGKNKGRLGEFYKNHMGGVYNPKQLATMYGIYQDNGEAKMFENKRPMDLKKGDFVCNNQMGEIGVLQDNHDRGSMCILEFQDRSFSVDKATHGWSKKNIQTADEGIQSSPAPSAHSPVAASSAQGPALFKEQVDCSQKNFIDATMKKIMAEVDHQEDAHTPKNDLMKGIEAEKEHAQTFKKIENEKPSVSKAAEMVAKDHLKENPDYYKHLTGKGKEMLISQDTNENGKIVNMKYEIVEPEREIEFADNYSGKMGKFGPSGANKGSTKELSVPKEPNFSSNPKSNTEPLVTNRPYVDHTVSQSKPAVPASTPTPGVTAGVAAPKKPLDWGPLPSHMKPTKSGISTTPWTPAHHQAVSMLSKEHGYGHDTNVMFEHIGHEGKVKGFNVGTISHKPETKEPIMKDGIHQKHAETFPVGHPQAGEKNPLAGQLRFKTTPAQAVHEGKLNEIEHGPTGRSIKSIYDAPEQMGMGGQKHSHGYFKGYHESESTKSHDVKMPTGEMVRFHFSKPGTSAKEMRSGAEFHHGKEEHGIFNFDKANARLAHHENKLKSMESEIQQRQITPNMKSSKTERLVEEHAKHKQYVSDFKEGMGIMRQMHETMKSSKPDANYGKIDVKDEYIRGTVERNIESEKARTGHASQASIPSAKDRADMTKQATGFQTTKGESQSEKVMNKAQGLFRKATSIYQPHHAGNKMSFGIGAHEPGSEKVLTHGTSGTLVHHGKQSVATEFNIEDLPHALKTHSERVKSVGGSGHGVDEMWANTGVTKYKPQQIDDRYSKKLGKGRETGIMGMTKAGAKLSPKGVTSRLPGTGDNVFTANPNVTHVNIPGVTHNAETIAARHTGMTHNLTAGQIVGARHEEKREPSTAGKLLKETKNLYRATPDKVVKSEPIPDEVKSKWDLSPHKDFQK